LRTGSVSSAPAGPLTRPTMPPLALRATAVTVSPAPLTVFAVSLSAPAPTSGVVFRLSMLDVGTGSIHTVRQMPDEPW
jgi:hypothetical protein